MGAITRFAPSPTGFLHLGHAFAALFASRAAAARGGRFLLRMEDIDQTRCRPEYDAAILQDMAWLGLESAGPVLRQSARLPAYGALLDSLKVRGLVYPCFCTRADARREAAGMQAAPHGSSGGGLAGACPGACRELSPQRRRLLLEQGRGHALRLDSRAALRQTGPLHFRDLDAGIMAVAEALCGDVVLARKDAPVSYHLAVVADDALQGVTLVTRGADLLEATHVQRLLQALLGFPAPEYHHHPVLAGHDGRRYAKRDGALALRTLRAGGWRPADIRRLCVLQPDEKGKKLIIRVPDLGPGG